MHPPESDEVRQDASKNSASSARLILAWSPVLGVNSSMGAMVRSSQRTRQSFGIRSRTALCGRLMQIKLPNLDPTAPSYIRIEGVKLVSLQKGS